MKRFLESVARYYLNGTPDLGRLLLVVPNKRSGMYLRYYIKMLADRPIVMPKIVTLGSYIRNLAGGGLEEATRLEQIFTLYKAHTSVRIENGLDVKPFDHFLFWGEIMLDDFDDIDLNMADVDTVLKNVSDYREIESDYLNEDQIAVARELWGYDLKKHGNGFWRHIQHGNPIDNAFITLWKILIPTYHKFHEDLRSRGLSTRGALAKMAAERTSEMSKEDFGRDRIGFVGFDLVNGSTKAIFRNLAKKGIADFFWDEPLSLTRDIPEYSTAFIPLKGYIKQLKKDFPMPGDYDPAAKVNAPRVTVYAVPSASMQTKQTRNILDRWLSKGYVQKDRPDSTAVVLPAPGVLTSLLYSLPDEDKLSLNITMGLPIRHTPFATFLSAVVKMYLRASEDKDGLSFLSEDIERILNHPSVMMLGSKDAVEAKRFLLLYRRVIVPVGEIRANAGSLSFLFSDEFTRSRTIEGVGRLFENIIGTMIDILEPIAKKIQKEKSDSGTPKLHEIRLLSAYREAINTIVDTALRFSREKELEDLSFDKRTFIVLLEKLLKRDTLNMSGAPMRGMQIMGPLETRSLDFDNIIMLSTNENTFPKKTFFRSLIPHSIRVGYNLTTVDAGEIQYSWIFYNLISRSRRAVFMYDARQGKIGSNEMSRYLYQLRHIFTGLPVKFDVITPVALKSDESSIIIEKTEEVKAELRRFLKGGDRHLSASSIKTYLGCPLSFYLKAVKGMSDDVKPTEYIDSSTIGTVIHAVFEDFFAPLKEVRIVPKNIEKRINPAQIRSLVATKIDKSFYRGRYSDALDNLPGEAGILTEVLSNKIVEALKNESKLRTEDFIYVDGEVRPDSPDKTVDWTLTPDLSIRFTYSIDRIDRFDDGSLRFIDYKSGGDSLKVSSVDAIFGTDKEKPAGAIFQILAYANVYADTHPSVKDITPEIFKVFDSAKSIGETLKIGEKKKVSLNISSFKDIPDFKERLAERLRPLFDDSTPIIQTSNHQNCTYCQFNSFCNRLDSDDKKW